MTHNHFSLSPQKSSLQTGPHGMDSLSLYSLHGTELAASRRTVRVRVRLPSHAASQAPYSDHACEGGEGRGWEAWGGI